MLMTILFAVQFIFSIIIGLYFLNMLKSQTGSRRSLEQESNRELNKLRRLKQIKLTEPLSEVIRPKTLEEIVGQSQGLKALRAAICSPNPQHVIIYGPPGVGKTAAARVVLEEAKKSPRSPFKSTAKYVEIDATTLRFDDRGIADPLIGTVHDPIYQGAGAYGPAGIPQPKPGAVTKAHGGMLFIDEIGELHPIQMNKLLKVLEDRRVFLESAYYSSSDNNIPAHIHEIFLDGLPADFRLVAATTRTPEEIPPALRSRCVEIFFKPLTNDDIIKIAKNAAANAGVDFAEDTFPLIAKYAQNGRDAVSIVQIAASLAIYEGRYNVEAKDVEWVIEFSQYNPKIEKKVSKGKSVGFVNGLAVCGSSLGMLMDIEVSAEKGSGQLKITGIVENEEFSNRGQKLTKKSSARASVENMLTVLKRYFNVDFSKYDIHINFPSSAPVDGPSAGVAIVCGVYSAIFKKPIDNEIAMTGEISIQGMVRPVGGIVAKVEAAKAAGVKKVIIPKDNYREIFKEIEGMEVIKVSNISDVFEEVFGIEKADIKNLDTTKQDAKFIAATGA
ncbi:MAG: ATP-dependent protease LonB [Eubacteriales bacterium]|jgi:Lon-like ATP-dependent protease|nr:ATP-dependent protease LonB [Eubacteriales bacterium]